jgi:hypothetical protein
MDRKPPTLFDSDPNAPNCNYTPANYLHIKPGASDGLFDLSQMVSSHLTVQATRNEHNPMPITHFIPRV